MVVGDVEGQGDRKIVSETWVPHYSEMNALTDTKVTPRMILSYLL